MSPRSHCDPVADRRTGLAVGDRLQLGRDTFTIVGLTDNQIASGGDPVIYLTLLDSQKLQFDLEPASARQEEQRQLAAGRTADVETDTVNAVVDRVSPGVRPEAVAEEVRRWKHLAAR